MKQSSETSRRQYGVEFWYQPKGPDTVFPMDPENLNNLKLVHSETGVTTVFKPTDFTQVNHALNDVMITRALRLLKLRTATDKVADFFCGLGNFTLPIATKSAKVVYLVLRAVNSLLRGLKPVRSPTGSLIKLPSESAIYLLGR